MRVYVETNFVLELVLEQEDHAACESILRFAEDAAISLALPAFSLAEASSKLTRRHDWRRLTSDDKTGRELGQLRRSATFGEETRHVEDSIQRLFAKSLQYDRDNLKRVNARLLRVATILPLSADVIHQLSASPFDGLEVPDAMVLFSILGDPLLGGEEACFVSRDAAACDDPDIRRVLAGKKCKFFRSFGRGEQYVGSHLARR